VECPQRGVDRLPELSQQRTLDNRWPPIEYESTYYSDRTGLRMALTILRESSPGGSLSAT
jgi:hypothetical protein